MRNPAAGGGYQMRFRLQRAAQGLLRRFDAGGAPLNWSEQPRVVSCHRNVQSDGVSVWRHQDGGGARFGNLVTCGSVWHCPVCAARIAEARRRDLESAMWHQRARGGAVYLATLTYPHEADLPLAESLERFGRALKRYKNSRAYKRVMQAAGRLGSVRSLEVTVGVNGWHPHTHDLVFAAPGLLDGQPATPEHYAGGLGDLRDAWIAALLKEGLGSPAQLADMQRHAFQLQGGEFAADYVAKFGRLPAWDLDREATAGHRKLAGRRWGDRDHFTPFTLLARYLDGDPWAAARFVEYAQCFEGRRMLTWSPGLRAKLGMSEELPDELAAAIPDDPAPAEELAARLDCDAWALVLSRDARGELLDIAASLGAAGVADFLEELRSYRAPTHGAAFRDYQGRPWLI